MNPREQTFVASSDAVALLQDCELVYLASPYSHPDPAVRAMRYDAAVRAVARLHGYGVRALSPIVASHPPAVYGSLRGDAAYWWPINRRLIDAADAVVVLELDGCERSTGVAQEVEYCKGQGKLLRRLPAIWGETYYPDWEAWKHAWIDWQVQQASAAMRPEDWEIGAADAAAGAIRA